MKKLFLILLFIVIANFSAHATDKADKKTLQCMSLFARGSASIQINDLIAPLDVKRRLFNQTIHSKNIKEFVVEFSVLIDELYRTRFIEALEGKTEVDYKSLGFNSIDEVRILKEMIINKQIKILSIMDSSDLTVEFANDFKRIVTRIYDTNISRKDVLSLNERLDNVILIYSKY